MTSQGVNMNVTMPKAAIAAWSAFAGDDFDTTDVVIKSKLTNEAAAKEQTGHERITKGKFTGDESIRLLARKLTTDLHGLLSPPPSPGWKEAIAPCPQCTDALVVIEEEHPTSARSHDHDHSWNLQESKSETSDSGHDESQPAYGLVVSFSKAASCHNTRVTMNSCQHVHRTHPDEETGEWTCWLQEAVRQLCNETPHKEKEEKEEKTTRTEIATTPSQEDLVKIWEWNQTVPETVHACVHDTIVAMARAQPTRPAVCAWDGELTYQELDSLSDIVAAALVDLGVGPGTIVPLCFEKSMWTPVAMLGVMKAGAASVAMDTTQPEERLRSIVEQALAHSCRRVLVSSEENKALADTLASCSPEDPATPTTTTVLILQALVQDHSCSPRRPATAVTTTTVRPNDALYIVFTSGSTGTPKGVVVTHANFSSAIAHHKAPLCFDATSRVLDFASYAFDVAWSDALHTLAGGGCMCIPSEAQRKGDLVAAIRALRANYLDLTPTVARQLRWADVPRVRTIVFGGERMAAADLEPWAPCANIRNPYGPAECTVTSTVLAITAPGTTDGNKDREPGIGRGCGTVTWIVRPDGAGLAAMGQTGELWLEGPLVAKGYLGNAEKTAAVFVENPPWLLQGVAGGVPGRRGRLYCTGDLVRYNADGSIHFMGRKDDQVKIRGQRVELGDVEHHLRQCLHVQGHPDMAIAADVTQPSDSPTPMLAAFLAIGAPLATGAAKGKEGIAPLAALTAPLHDALATRLPVHMVPVAYVPVAEMPTTGTGKTDRRLLRALVAAMTLAQVADLHPLAAARGEPRRAPRTEAERRLQELWSAVLGVDADRIAATDYFSQLGGDSIAAMRLVAAARARGWTLAIAHVFRHPQLSEMATKLGHESVAGGEVVPFSLVHVDRARVVSLLQRYYPQGAVIQDVLPITDFQAFCIQYAMATPLGRTQQVFVDLPSSIDADHLLDSCHRLWQHVDMLRAIFIQLDGEYLQVIPENIALDITSYAVNTSVQEAAQEWFSSDTAVLTLGKCDVRMAVFRSPAGDARLAIRLCHAQYDGFMLAELGTCLAALLNGAPLLPPAVSFAHHLRTVRDRRAPSAAHWRSLLHGSALARLPCDAPRASWTMDMLTVRVPAPSCGAASSAANAFFAVAATAIARLTRSDDITVGILVSGRAVSPHQLDIAGPCANFIPLRVRFDSGQVEQGRAPGEEVVRRIHDQRIASLDHEASQMSDVAEASGAWAPGEQFGFILQFQNIDEDPSFDVHGESRRFQVAERPMVYVDPTIYVLAKPQQGKEWSISFVSSPKFYQPGTIQRLADVVHQVAREC